MGTRGRRSCPTPRRDSSPRTTRSCSRTPADDDSSVVSHVGRPDERLHELGAARGPRRRPGPARLRLPALVPGRAVRAHLEPRHRAPLGHARDPVRRRELPGPRRARRPLRAGHAVPGLARASTRRPLAPHRRRAPSASASASPASTPARSSARTRRPRSSTASSRGSRGDGALRAARRSPTRCAERTPRVPDDRRPVTRRPAPHRPPGGHLRAPPRRPARRRAGRRDRAGRHARRRRASTPTSSRLDGAWLGPGLRDHHVHFDQWALVRRRVDVPGATAPRRPPTVLARGCPRAGARGPRPLVGYGYRDGLWPRPHDASCSTRPHRASRSSLISADLHAVWLQHRAPSRTSRLRGRPLGLLREDGVLREQHAFDVTARCPGAGRPARRLRRATPPRPRPPAG